MAIPMNVQLAAAELANIYPNGYIEELGAYQGQTAYTFVFPDDAITGYPFVYLSKDDTVKEITGVEALEILAFFTES